MNTKDLIQFTFLFTLVLVLCGFIYAAYEGSATAAAGTIGAGTLVLALCVGAHRDIELEDEYEGDES